MKTMLYIAARNLARHSKRTLLLGGLLASVTLLLVLMLGVMTGLQRNIFETATTLMTGEVNVGGFFKASEGQANALISDYAKVEALVRKEVPELRYVSHRERAWVKLVSDHSSLQLTVVGVDLAQEPDLPQVLHVEEGSLAGLGTPDTVLLFREQARKLGVGVGDMLTLTTLTNRGVHNTADVRVAGIARDIGLLSAAGVFVPNATVRALLQYKDSVTSVLQLYLKPGTSEAVVQDRLRKALAAAGYDVMADDRSEYYAKVDRVQREPWVGQRLDVTTWEYELWILRDLLLVLNALVYALTCLLLAVVSVGLLNAFWIAIRERTSEIGTLRAMGMQRWAVARLFLAEAALLGLASTAAGMVLGLLASAGLNALHVSLPSSVRLLLMRDTLLLGVDGQRMAVGGVFIVLWVVVISFLPAMKAARLQPVIAMREAD